MSDLPQQPSSDDLKEWLKRTLEAREKPYSIVIADEEMNDHESDFGQLADKMVKQLERYEGK